MQRNLNRREFVAISTVATATSAMSSSALARPASSIFSAASIQSPKLAIAAPSSSNPNQARLIEHTRMSPLQQLPKSTSLSLTPLPCVDGRLACDSAISIELYHPKPNLYSTLYSAHNITIPNRSIPVFGSSIQTPARSSWQSQISLRITQRRAGQDRTNQIAISSLGTYLLAVPTTRHNSSANFRFTTAQLDNHGTITNIQSSMPAASAHCAYFSITINDKNSGV